MVKWWFGEYLPVEMGKMEEGKNPEMVPISNILRKKKIVSTDPPTVNF